ncbi:hypothetical protein FTUN_1033 [Frigoriglobus tundricola]|uniref:Uncharacterized protein n=1 Tax=Frigoriglobus tundricola TaxID=2774151 RepID=A0A6M5YJS6_9BACT|nr:hypothetical protein FTUN_1033 [Frigoriglobus tundricola]
MVGCCNSTTANAKAVAGVSAATAPNYAVVTGSRVTRPLTS